MFIENHVSELISILVNFGKSAFSSVSPPGEMSIRMIVITSGE